MRRNDNFDRPVNRREMLRRSGVGFGSLALANLLFDSGLSVSGAESGTAASATPGSASPASSLAPREPHFPAKAKRVIHLFMNGGPSQIDTFDPKPELKKWDGKSLGSQYVKDQRLGGAGFPSTFKFAKHGQCGMDVSELLPNLAKCVDDMCFIRSMQTDVPNHEPGLMMMNCGNISQPRPCLGSWALYGLGTVNQSLPGFVVMCPNGLPTAQSANWRSAFLPGIYQGTHVDSQYTEPDELVANVRNDYLVGRQQRRQLTYIQRLNQMHLEQRTGDPQLEARIESLELAFRMQSEALDAFDVTREPAHIRQLYGDTLQGRQLLIARRLAERGVRYVQVYHGAGQPWDSHSDIQTAHTRLTKEADQATAALLTDLKQQGMLEDTLVIWGGEIGRTPTVQLPVGPKPGRDHHHNGYTYWMAGGGVKPGFCYGSTNELGLEVAENPVHVHDLHATILHLLGFDHTKLTFHYAGRDFRLTDIHGRVVEEILA